MEQAPDGARRRERRKLTLSSKSGARRWAEARERQLLTHGPATARKEVPTFEVFAPRFLDGHARANRQKPSGVAAKETILRLHLIPLFGRKTLDAITNEDVQRLKLRLRDTAPKTTNNILATLRRLLSAAVEWDVIDAMPCTIRQVKTSRPVMSHRGARFTTSRPTSGSWRRHKWSMPTPTSSCFWAARRGCDAAR